VGSRLLSIAWRFNIPLEIVYNQVRRNKKVKSIIVHVTQK